MREIGWFEVKSAGVVAVALGSKNGSLTSVSSSWTGWSGRAREPLLAGTATAGAIETEHERSKKGCDTYNSLRVV